MVVTLSNQATLENMDGNYRSSKYYSIRSTFVVVGKVPSLSEIEAFPEIEGSYYPILVVMEW